MLSCWDLAERMLNLSLGVRGRMSPWEEQRGFRSVVAKSQYGRCRVEGYFVFGGSGTHVPGEQEGFQDLPHKKSPSHCCKGLQRRRRPTRPYRTARSGGLSHLNALGIKKPPGILLRASKKAATYSPTLVAVPSALTGLTSLFGMVRGGPRRHGHLSFTSNTLIRAIRRFPF